MGKVGRTQKSRHRAAKKAAKGEKMSHQQTPKRFLFGMLEAQDDFSRRHQEMLKEYPKIRAAQDRAISSATKRMKVMDDKVIYFLARQVFEDFDEVLLLCGNGLSTGALKILRGMFERTVTICYLQKHPEDIGLYYKYYYVRRRKEINAVLQDFPNSISSERLDEYEKQFEDVRGLFQIPVCEFVRSKNARHVKKPESITHGFEKTSFRWRGTPEVLSKSFGLVTTFQCRRANRPPKRLNVESSSTKTTNGHMWKVQNQKRIETLLW